MVYSYGIIAFRTIRNEITCSSLAVPFQSPDCVECKMLLERLSFLEQPEQLNVGDRQYLMVQRKDTHSLVDIMRGKWKLPISTWWNEMTCLERWTIRNFSFEQIWSKKFWAFYTARQFHRYKDFLLVAKDYFQDTNHEVHHHISSEFGFPKGRRDKKHESVFECAIREFCEETGYTEKVLNFPFGDVTFTESFIGTNGIKYDHVYWIAEIHQSHGEPVISNDYRQTAEIQNVGWFKLHQCYLLFRKYDSAKKDVLQRIDEYINHMVVHDNKSNAHENNEIIKK